MIASLLLLLQSAAVPGGQASSPPGAPRASCRTFETGSANEGEGAILYVGCGQSAARIGRVESHRSSYNPGLATLAMVVRERDRTRVLVVRSAVDGTVEVQDVSRDLAKLAGQPFNVELRGLAPDLGRFAADGSLAAPGSGQSQSGARLTADRYAPPAAERRRADPETAGAGSAR